MFTLLGWGFGVQQKSFKNRSEKNSFSEILEKEICSHFWGFGVQNKSFKNRSEKNKCFGNCRKKCSHFWGFGVQKKSFKNRSGKKCFEKLSKNRFVHTSG